MKLPYSLVLIGAVVLVVLYLYTRNVSWYTSPVITSNYTCNVDSDCAVVSTNCCNNNAPSQNTCINKQQFDEWNFALIKSCQKNLISCAQYLVQAQITCFCNNNICTTNYTSSNENLTYVGIYGGK